MIDCELFLEKNVVAEEYHGCYHNHQLEFASCPREETQCPGPRSNILDILVRDWTELTSRDVTRRILKVQQRLRNILTQRPFIGIRSEFKDAVGKMRRQRWRVRFIDDFAWHFETQMPVVGISSRAGIKRH
jgi:hypothetical protein